MTGTCALPGTVDGPDRAAATARTFPWYDSQWLRAFHACRDHLVDRHPERCDDFDDQLEVLRTRSDFVAGLHDLIDAPTHQRLLDRLCVLTSGRLTRYERQRFGRDILHDDPVFTEVQESLAGSVSTIVGESVEVSYNFLSLYGQAGRCAPHMDAPSAKWTVDHCLEISHPWPLHVGPVESWPDGTHPPPDWHAEAPSEPSARFTQFTQRAGDTLVFGGSSQWHGRSLCESSSEPFSAKLVFFHFVPEGTRELIDPASWPQRFDLPCLGPIVHTSS